MAAAALAASSSRCFASHSWRAAATALRAAATSASMAAARAAPPVRSSSICENSCATQKRPRRSHSVLLAAHVRYWRLSARSFSSVGVISSCSTLVISATLSCFFSIVFCAATFFASYMRVPAASSMRPRISGGFMLSTLVMRPCMMRKCGLFTFSCTEWKKFCTCVACTVCPLIRYLLRPPIATCARGGAEERGGTRARSRGAGEKEQIRR